MISAYEILEKSRAAGHRLPYNEAAVLFAGAVRLAAANDSTVRGRLVRIDDAGGLHVEAFDEQAPEAEPAYLAPELLSADAPDKSDPKVQVYAAGVLGYELLTGRISAPPGQPPGPELTGPLGDVVRRALAVDRRERIEDLRQLHEMVEEIQPRPPAEGERNILSALRTRFSRPPPEKEALAKLIDRLHQLEAQVAQLGKAQARLEASLRESSETIERFEIGQTRVNEAGRRRQSVVAPAMAVAAITAGAILAAAWWFGLLAIPSRSGPSPLANVLPSQEPVEATYPARDAAVAEVKPAPSRRAAAEPAPVPAEPKPAPAEATPAAAASTAAPAEATPAPAATAETLVDAGSAAIADNASADAGLTVGTDAGEPHPAAAPTPSPAPPPAKRQASSRAAMLHALALSQVRRGEDALEQGKADEALASFKAALENEATNAVAFRGLGMAYAMQGQDAQALQAYDKYLRLMPSALDAPAIRRSMTELRARASAGAKK
jgi:tetratricopeptide (TPR) repeat protein